MPAVVVDLLFGIAFIAVGGVLFAQRHRRVELARERGHGIKSQAVHNTLAIVMILVGLWSILTAFV